MKYKNTILILFVFFAFNSCTKNDSSAGDSDLSKITAENVNSYHLKSESIQKLILPNIGWDVNLTFQNTDQLSAIYFIANGVETISPDNKSLSTKVKCTGSSLTLICTLYYKFKYVYKDGRVIETIEIKRNYI